MRSSVEVFAITIKDHNAIGFPHEQAAAVPDSSVELAQVRFRNGGGRAIAYRARTGSKPAIFLCLLLAWSLQISLGQTAIPKAVDIGVHFERAQAALKANDAETATREFRAVLALDPRNAEAYVNLGVVALSQGDYRAASQYLHKALAIRPSLAQAQALLGICDKRLGNSSAKALLTSSFSKLTDTRLRTQVGMELLGFYQQAGDTEHAIPVIQKLVDLNPENVDILYAAQRLYGELSEETLNKLAVLAPRSARMQQVIAERLINAGDLRGAIEHYKKAMEIDPRLPGVHYELAQAILESAPSDSAVQADAEKEVGTAITMEGDNAKSQCELGRIALLRADSEKAYAHYTRAFAMDPGDTQAQLGLGRVLMTMEKPQEAKKYLEMAVHSDPFNGAAHYRLAMAYKGLQMANEAQKEMHLFQEIKKTKDQVRELYHQMNSQPKEQADETPDSDK
jgi:tetratricopeptide (TPR) repeat protein